MDLSTEDDFIWTSQLWWIGYGGIAHGTIIAESLRVLDHASIIPQIITVA